MNYKRIYDEIISNAKSRGLKKSKLQGYFEKHHIVPKCLGGLNKNSNYVLLTGREHYLCHWLLWKLYTGNKSLFFAYKALSNMSKHGRLSSKQYEKLKIEHSKLCSIIHSGKTISESQIEAIKLKNTGRIFSKSHKLKLRKAKLGIRFTDEHKEKLKLSHPKGINKSTPKRCRINDIEYESINDASKKLNISNYIITKRLNDEKFNTYVIFD